MFCKCCLLVKIDKMQNKNETEIVPLHAEIIPLEPEFSRRYCEIHDTTKNSYAIEDEHIEDNRKSALKASMDLSIAPDSEEVAKENQLSIFEMALHNAHRKFTATELHWMFN